MIQAIQETEKQTSAEIRVHLERKTKGDILEHAKREFERLGMTNTRERNGVLIFLCTASRGFAIIGDSGIDQKVAPPNDRRAGATFWSELAAVMGQKFAEDRFADGIVDVIHTIGDLLKQHFPYQRNDINELPDAISYSF